MSKNPALVHYVVVNDLSKPVDEQEGILIEVEGRGGDTENNRVKAKAKIEQMWKEGEIEADKFPDGITPENIIYVPPVKEEVETPATSISEGELPPVVQGAQEILQLTKLQIEVQEAAEEASPYVPIIQTILDRNRPLSAEEKDLAKDKKYGKTIEKLAQIIAHQEDYQQKCTGKAQLILNAIAWQLEREEKDKKK